ncbi:MAG: hypothetical protein ACRDX8_14725 [Acidimicrobiales bacterium]
MRVHRSAHRHGIEDQDIHHAVAHALAEIELEGADGEVGRLLILGPDRAGNLLEVVSVEQEADALAIHAMRMRPQFGRWLSPRDREEP